MLLLRSQCPLSYLRRFRALRSNARYRIRASALTAAFVSGKPHLIDPCCPTHLSRKEFHRPQLLQSTCFGRRQRLFAATRRNAPVPADPDALETRNCVDMMPPQTQLTTKERRGEKRVGCKTGEIYGGTGCKNLILRQRGHGALLQW